MTREEITSTLIEIIEDILPEGDCSNLDPEVRLRDQLELDSMDFLDIVMELRKGYRIEIPEEDYPKLASLKSSVDYLEPKMRDL